MRREERVTAQGPVKKQPPDGMSHRGLPPPPPPLPMFETDSQNFASAPSVPRGFTLKNRGTLGGGGSQPNPPPPPFRPPLPAF